MDELTREFLIESQEGLDRMERCLTELEDRPQDGELLADIFRSVHTIKGTTGFLGYSRLESLSHAGENLLGMLRDGKLIANGEIISALLLLLDGLRAILASIETDGSEGDGDDRSMIERLCYLQNGNLQNGNLQRGSDVAEAHKPEAAGMQAKVLTKRQHRAHRPDAGAAIRRHAPAA